MTTFRRGVPAVLVVSLRLTILLVVSFDLEGPTRGLIRIPATPLIDVRATMAQGPAADAPGGP